MRSEQDEETLHILRCFKDRLKGLIRVVPVMDALDFLKPETKERIKARFDNQGDISAADHLIEDIINGDYDPGWSRTLITALETGGCMNAARYVMNSPPEPREEAENDDCIRLIDLLHLSLVTMKTVEIMKATEKGNTEGARLLLRRLVKNDVGWFSKFLHVLETTEHHQLVRELRGEFGSDDEGISHTPETALIHSDPTPSFSEEVDSSLNTSTESSVLDTSAENEEIDMYKGEEEKEDSASSTGGVDRQIITLRDYQLEVAKPALEKKNIIICLPTGSGKTRVAVFITKDHLDKKKQAGERGKVLVLVNKVPLVEQHYKNEFGRFLKHQYSVERITLMVIDECHHTQKGGVYNHIMIRYLKQKHQNHLLKKEEKRPVPIPQILGLTASPGVGGATKQKTAEDHILRICANLDAFTIKTKEEETKTPFKKVENAEERKEDPFGDVIKKIMDEIHAHADLQPLSEPGTQNYEQWVVLKEQNAAKEENQKVRVCAEHLRQYNEALYQSNTIRMSDAFSFLVRYHNEKLKTKSFPDEEDNITITDTERFLFTLFQDKKAKLQELMGKPQYENNNLSRLKTHILKEFSSRADARGIIFTRTRLSAITLSQWIQENSKFEEVGVKASYLIGGGDQSVVKPMTPKEQKDVLKRFRNGEINLLIATTVAEEGLDIPECNVVISYCYVTNEIAMIQARGRGRAEDSSYTLIAEASSGVLERDKVNEYRETMMSKAIAKICNMDRDEYEKKIKEFQIQVIIEERMKAKKKKQKVMMKEPPSKISLNCRDCFVFVCSGDDIEIIEDMHHVNVNQQFRELFKVRKNESLPERLLDYENSGVIVCKACGRKWGSMMLYKSIKCPCLKIENFVVKVDEKKATCNHWEELPTRFRPFDYALRAELLTQDSDE
ncbi:hypothetical protein DNTS_028295 [Danionella cerebrum]|uniref:RNA helicase n=1 Tax=Danionella cerebrum TaxID=2873325 RepID=A0A553NL68_9TELE|nr:hypothetical protein DNTS_028295 [Danionella translucida]